MGRVRAFDDAKSFLHAAYAAVIAMLNPVIAVAATLVYIEYQRYEREKWSRKRGDFAEWLIGLLIGAIVRAISA